MTTKLSKTYLIFKKIFPDETDETIRVYVEAVDVAMKMGYRMDWSYDDMRDFAIMMISHQSFARADRFSVSASMMRDMLVDKPKTAKSFAECFIALANELHPD